ncbi:MAG: hypothetical protein ACFFEK_14000 [Candidatus Thorarchaeota archaeon]
MVGGSRFPKFERWIEKEYPSVYQEEYYHRSELPVGILLSVFGFYPWVLTNFAFGILQILGLIASLSGLLLLFWGFIAYRKKLKVYSYHGLSRNTISDAISVLDSKIVQPDELVSPAPYFNKRVDSAYNLGLKEREFLRFVKSTTGLFEWPSSIIDEMKLDIDKMRRATPRCSILFLIVSILLLFWAYSLLAFSLLIAFGIFPVFFILQESYYYYQYALRDLHLVNEKWIRDLLESDSVQPEEVMKQILYRLQSEFPFPLRFYLAKEYPILVYTGRTKTTFTLARLREAVLYPQDGPTKEEVTGA